jgi:large subunit ribosomal protein L25
MGDKVVLTVEERNVLGKKVKQLRKQGMIPAIVYGSELKAALPVQAESVAALKAWRSAGKHHVVELTVGGKKRLAMIKSADLEPAKRTLRHLSLHVVKQNENVETEVPVRIVGAGETPAEKAGLVVLTTIEAVQVSAFPGNLPDFVEVPGEKLAAEGDHVTVADIIAVEGVEVTADPEQIVATVYEPAALAAANEAAGGDATEDTEVEAENGSEETPGEAEQSDAKPPVVK